MPKVLVLYYSSYGHIEAMAHAVADGARSAGAEAEVKRVPETVPEEVARKSGYKLDQAAPIATVEELPTYDAIIIGTGTRYGRLTSQMAAFLDRTGGLWARGALNGKVGAAFTSPPPSMAVRRQPCSRSSPTCSTSAWWWSACPTRSRARCVSTRSRAAHPTAR